MTDWCLVGNMGMDPEGPTDVVDSLFPNESHESEEKYRPYVGGTGVIIMCMGTVSWSLSASPLPRPTPLHVYGGYCHPSCNLVRRCPENSRIRS